MKAYFSHDEGARNDPKLVKVLMRLGQAGKGVYWDLVEMLYEQGGHLPLAEIESYAFALRTEPELIVSLVNDFGLFAKDADRFWSETALERLQMREAKAERRAAAGAKGGKARAEREAAAKALLEQEQSNTQAMLEQSLSPAQASKGKEIKEKEKDGREECQPASQPLIASPVESKKPEPKKPRGAAGAALWPDETKVFTIARFADYTASIGFGNIDRGRYLPQIQNRAEEKNEQRTEGGWELFIREYLNTEVRYNRLMLADPPGGFTAPPSGYKNPNGPAPTPKTTGYSLAERVKAQQTATYF